MSARLGPRSAMPRVSDGPSLGATPRRVKARAAIEVNPLG